MPSSSGADAKRPAAKARAERVDVRIHDEIYAAIVHHQLQPGTPLQEDALASAFGISRTIIRKVLQQMSHEKLVELIPNKGAIVARPSVEEARQVFDARRAVEGLLVTRLAPTITERRIERLRSAVEAERKAQERGDKRRQLQLSGDFHLELASFAGNDVLHDFVQELISRSSLIIALYELPGAVPCSCEEHEQIVDALASRDPGLAARQMENHLHHIEAQMGLSDVPARVDFKALFKPLT